MIFLRCKCKFAAVRRDGGNLKQCYSVLSFCQKMNHSIQSPNRQFPAHLFSSTAGFREFTASYPKTLYSYLSHPLEKTVSSPFTPHLLTCHPTDTNTTITLNGGVFYALLGNNPKHHCEQSPKKIPTHTS